MKPSFFAPLSILLYITILFLQQISFADTQKGVVEIACAHTKARDLCIYIIKSDPRNANGNPRAFCIIVLEKARSKADSLKRKCPEAYMKIVDDIGDAIEKLKTKQPVPKVVDSILSAIKDVASCSNGFGSILILLKIALDILKIIK